MQDVCREINWLTSTNRIHCLILYSFSILMTMVSASNSKINNVSSRLVILNCLRFKLLLTSSFLLPLTQGQVGVRDWCCQRRKQKRQQTLQPTLHKFLSEGSSLLDGFCRSCSAFLRKFQRLEAVLLFVSGRPSCPLCRDGAAETRSDPVVD